MKVGVTYHSYYINNVQATINKLELKIKEERIAIDNIIEFFNNNRDIYIAARVNIDKLISIGKGTAFDKVKLHSSLSRVVLSKDEIHYLSDYIRLCDSYYHKDLKRLQTLRIASTMPYTIFISILRAYNLFNLRKVFKGSKFYLGKNIGTISMNVRPRIARPDGTSDSIDYIASKKVKQAIIDKGEIPYSKKDAEEAVKQGIEYKGKPYLVYFTKDDIWYSFKTNSNCILNNVSKYRFLPSNYCNYDKTKYSNTQEFYDTFKTFEEVINSDILGSTQKIRAIETLDSNFRYSLKN